MKIGLFFGSFNPIHSGHLIIAQYILEEANLDKVWFVVSPQNPLKKRASLAHEQDRYDMVQAAVFDNYAMEAMDIEFGLPRPSYTIDTLTYLTDKFPDNEFVVIMGEDNLEHIRKWKNYDVLLKDYKLIVYPRPKSKGIGSNKFKNVIKIDAPLINISATKIRKMISEGKSVQYLLPESVIAYIRMKKLYDFPGSDKQ